MAQINKPSEYFNTVTFTGNSSTQSITGVGFQPDWVWFKNRSQTYDHQAFDVVRGVTKRISPNTTSTETTQSASLTSFDSDGFSVGNYNPINESPNGIVSWNWKANGAGASNTDGSITSTVSANTTSGFSIVKYTGNSTAGATIGHGLGVAPEIVFYKSTTLSPSGWLVYSKALGATKELELNATTAGTTSSVFNNQDPTSTNLIVNTNAGNNSSSHSYVAYCFAEKKGFSKFGSYVGNASGSDNAFVYCGFKPAYVMTKCTSIDGDRWTLYDNKRDPINPTYRRLFPDGDIAESLNTNADIDLLSNGFKIRTDAGTSGAAQTYIYMAFAENPLVGTNNIPATAR